AGHQLGFVDRLLDRIDRRLEVDDDAAADAARLGDAETDDVEPAAVHDLADHRGHLRGADVEPDQVSFLSRHRVPLKQAYRPALLLRATCRRRGLPARAADAAVGRT